MISPENCTIIPHLGSNKEQEYALEECLVSLIETGPKMKIIVAKNGDPWGASGDTDLQCKAEEAVYGNEMAVRVAESKIILGFNVNNHCWGYWSNRVGKILTLRGFCFIIGHLAWSYSYEMVLSILVVLKKLRRR